ncbi:hypothetical protein SELMODRAFT_109138 [Selaginella moellendorffii]|uniref:t-SNARE coiled-coil homology domain-containing protein n=1 Tax=Selaginella moellendorffii TaxID=88036 RepID=D8S5I1_SELML|nr:syntaxin-124 [Selaginella moellendorffii]EFJ20598.1 hypothetical protein SELMODRAFT_109138 [Selaginella moellendorffii]|eukprot:XP_002978612.1 syntaxin-124 [Selaginella moellendorffii]
MNNLLSSSFPRGSDMEANPLDVEMAVHNSEKSLVGFFEEVSRIKDAMDAIQELLLKLNEDNESSKSVHKPGAMRELRSRMDEHVSLVLKNGRAIKSKLEALDASNLANRKVKGCEEGSSTDRTRMSITNSLRIKLRDLMADLANLRERMSSEYRGTIERRYFTVTGEQASQEVIERMIQTGESENFLRKAIQEQGRGQILDTIQEIQERHDAVVEVERNLRELQQIFQDLATLVDAQGAQLNTIEEHVNKAASFVDRGTQQLVKAKRSQRRSRKWTCIGIILLIIILLVILLPILTRK